MKAIGGCCSLRLVLVVLALSAGGLSANAADLQYPLSIAVAESGEIYLADRNLHGIWKLQGETLTLFYEGSKSFQTPLNAIRCVAVDRDGKLLAGDSSTRDVYRFDDKGQPVGLTQKPPAETPAAASGNQPSEKPAAPATESKPDEAKKDPADGVGQQDEKKEEKAEKKDEAAISAPEPAPKLPPPTRRKLSLGQIGIPMDIAVAKNGDVFVSDLEIHRIIKIPKTGGDIQEFAHVQAPRGLCFDADDNLWVVSGRRLVRIAPSGEKTTVVDDKVFNFPHTVAVGADKTAYVCDGYEKAIWRIPAGGKPEKLVSGEPLKNPVGMRLSGDKLYVTDPHAKAVFQITLDGKLTAMPLKQGG